MKFPDTATGDVFRRLEASEFDFLTPHDVEFFAVFPTEADADLVAQQYLDDHKSGQRFVNIETQPHPKGGMELLLVKTMLLDYEEVAAFEAGLEARANSRGGRLDGWGVLQEPPKN